jgi:hypothetical protein
MSKINDLINKLEDSTVTSHDFVESKVRIQDELYKILGSAKDGSPLYLAVSKMYRSWARLGGGLAGVKAGTLADYVSNIADLKAFMKRYEEDDEF